MIQLRRRFTLIFLALLASASVLLAGATKITIIHVNDTHSHLDAVGPKDADLNGTLGGIARAATVIGTLRATEPNVILLHAGDLFQGDPFFNKYMGVPELQVMKQLGFDAMAVGNHEFDFGPGPLNDVLTTAFADGSLPLLSANLDMSAFPALQQWIHPSLVKTVDGVKVGIFGMTVPNNPTNQPAPVIVRDDIIPVAQSAVNDLKSQGADVIICLSHLGVFYDRMVVAGVTGINFVVGGHDHNLYLQPEHATDPEGKSVPIVQAGEHYKYVGELHFTVDNGTVTMNDYSIIDVNSSVQPEPTIAGIIESLKQGIVDQFGDLYHTKIGTAQSEVAKKFDPASPLRDTPIGNLVTDAFRNKTNTDLAITALGLISEKIYKGPITGADVFRSVSYGFDEATGLGFNIATFDITGAELVKGLEIGLSQLELGDDFFLQVSGMRYTFDPSKPVGSRVNLGSVHIGNRRLDPSHTYSVTVNTGIVMLLQSLGVEVSNIDVRSDFEFTVLRDYIARLRLINEHPQGRIRIQHEAGDKPDPTGQTGCLRKPAGLFANYPNPFNPATSISFEVMAEARVTLKIYNVAGQEIATLVDGVKSPGMYQSTWDASLAPSGVYYAALISSGNTRMIRLLLIR